MSDARGKNPRHFNFMILIKKVAISAAASSLGQYQRPFQPYIFVQDGRAEIGAIVDDDPTIQVAARAVFLFAFGASF